VMVRLFDLTCKRWSSTSML